jgi:protein SCO1/2
MNVEVLKRMAMIVWFAAGMIALTFAVLIGPNFFPLSVKSDRVYLTKPFKLLDQNGRVVTEQDFRKKPTAWFFGFTHCPDVCPTTLSDLTVVLKRLGPEGDKLNVVFVTVDPERDTPEVLKEYLSSFDPRIIGLTGSREAIDAMTKGHSVHQATVPSANGGYMMEHSPQVLMTTTDARFVGTIDHQDPMETQVQKIRKLLREK